jgi:hypothetical protein
MSSQLSDAYNAGSQVDGYFTNNDLPDLNEIFDFEGASQVPDGPRTRNVSSQPSRARTPGGYEKPALSDRGRSGSHGIRLTTAEISSDDDDDGLFADHLSDAGTESGDEAVDDEAVSEDGDGGESIDTALEWKIDHSSGDHRLNGTLAHNRNRIGLMMCSTGFYHKDRIN